VQRIFEVERGQLRFFGEADLNPTLDISAVHTVRQLNQETSDRDVRIRVKIGGTLVTPVLAFESADDLNLSTSDLLSYLVTGAPSFEVRTEGDQISNTAIAALLPSLGAWLSGRLGGGFIDVIELQTAGLDNQSIRSLETAGSGLIAGTRIGGGKQVNDRLYVGVNLGLCPFAQAVTGNDFRLRELDPRLLLPTLGLKADYRLQEDWTLSGGIEPATNALVCAQAGANLGGTLVQTPRQVGFDLFKKWEF
jgi:translocation and assembly module TamB